MPTYESVGTVRIEIAAADGIKAFFIPDGDHEVKNEGKSYAIFLREFAGTIDLICRPIGDRGVLLSILPREDMGKTASDLKITEIAVMLGVLSASNDQTKVKAKVEPVAPRMRGDPDLKLTEMIVPAK